MKPQHTTPDPRNLQPSTAHITQPQLLHCATQNTKKLPSQQQTLWNFVCSKLPASNTTNVPQESQHSTINMQQSDNIITITSEPATPVTTLVNPTKRLSLTQIPPAQEGPTSQQVTLHLPSHNDPWGNIWVVPKLTSSFWIVSKNMGTLNMNNLDMVAITQEL